MSQKNIVILGGSYAGIEAMHYITKFIVPSLHKPAEYHVYLVNPVDQVYHKPAAPRAILGQDAIPDSKISISIPNVVKQYSETVTFLLGKATSVDGTKRVLDIALNDGSAKKLDYHALVIATGARSVDPVLSNQNDSGRALHLALEDMRSRLQTAKHIIIGGGGPAGVEVAGEVAEAFNGKPGWFSGHKAKVDIQLISASERLLPILRPALGKLARNWLADMGATTTLNTRIERTEKLPSGKTKVYLTGGKAIETDVYINAIGAIPNTEFLPREWLDSQKKVASSNTLRVDAAGPRVYAVGDVGAHTRGGLIDLPASMPVLGTNLRTDLEVAAGQKAKYGDRTFAGVSGETQVVTLGKSRGIGAFNGYKLPSIMIWALKGRDYGAAKFASSSANGQVSKEVAWKNPVLAAW